MPPHLHPRSAATSTLFAGTLAASFIVVGIPHIFPCPRPRKGYADSERQVDANGSPIRRRKRAAENSATNEKVLANAPQMGSGGKLRNLQEEAELFKQLEAEAKVVRKESHECPVPKPTGLVGRFLGFENGQKSSKPEELVS